MPSAVQNILWWNPLLHASGVMRTGFYPTYDAAYVSYGYTYGLALGLIFMPVPKPAEKPVVIRPLASKAKRKKRHWGLMLAFLVIVLLPVAVTVWYLHERAEDQYASTIAFTVRSEDVSSASDLLGGIAPALGGSSSSGDADILYEFIRSQALVQQVDDTLDLRSLYARNVDQDPIFHFHPEGTIEDLTQYWQRMVRTSGGRASETGPRGAHRVPHL